VRAVAAAQAAHAAWLSPKQFLGWELLSAGFGEAWLTRLQATVLDDSRGLPAAQRGGAMTPGEAAAATAMEDLYSDVLAAAGGEAGVAEERLRAAAPGLQYVYLDPRLWED
jgi:hypothetical protein